MMWSHQVTGLWVVFGSSVHRISWNCGLRYDCQLVQGGQICCFHQVAAMLPFSFRSVWSTSPLASWGNSVLNAALCPRDQLWDPSPSLLWEVSLLSQPLSQPLCLFQSLLDSGGSSGKLACHPTLALSLCCFTCVSSLRVWLLVPPRFSGASVPSSALLLVLDYSLLFMFFSFAGGGVQSVQGLCWIFFPGGSREILHCAGCSLVHSAVSRRQLWSWLMGRNDSTFFQCDLV
jgi:hypothetical protein